MNLNAIRISGAHFHVPRKLFLVMKITTFILLISVLTVSAATYAQKITLNEKRSSLKDVLAKIRQQSGYDIIYSNDMLDGAKTVTINLNNAPFNEAMKAILDEQGLEYRLEDGTVIIKAKEQSFIDNIKAAFAQVTIRGKVIDELGNPLPGASVVEKGTTNGTRTDQNGSFTLTVSDENKIVAFSFIGYEPIELRAKDFATGSTITLKASTTNLKEVVVSKGYYSTTQALNTGNVTRIDGDDIKKQPVSDPIMALEGRVAGLQISQSSGVPGAYSTVKLRGQNSIANGNKPFYIVDGVPFTSTSMTSNNVTGGVVGFPTSNLSANTGGTQGGLSPFNNLDPSDIESIEVLKDADATAIYGSRGANGVILITTRKGKVGKTKVDIDASSAIGSIAHKMQMMNTQQYLSMRRQAFTNDGKLPASTDFDANGTWDPNAYTDWEKLMIGNNSRFDNIQASISGGNNNTTFRIAGGTSKQTTVFPGDFNDKKSSFSFNLNHNSDDKRFHILFSGNYVRDINLLPGSDFTSNIFLAPNAPSNLVDPNGNLVWTNIPFNNPYQNLKSSYQAITDILTSNMNLGYNLFPGLELAGNTGYTHMQLNQSNIIQASFYRPPNNVNAARRTNSKATTDLNTWIIEPQLNYNRSIGDGKLAVSFGTSFQENKMTDFGIRATNFTSDDQVANFALGSTIAIAGNNSTLYHYSALYGRISYNWKEKYLLNVTARRDGSSRFGPENQFGNFGAVGAGWIFTEENFIKKTFRFLSFGKLRTSYGLTGNDQLSDYAYMSSYSPYTTSTYQGLIGLYPTNITNPYYGWETVKKLEGGLELGILQNRFNLSFSYYRNRTGNQLVGYSMPSTTGFTTITANLPAIIQNSGLEIELNSININAGKFRWTSTFNLTIPNNKLVSYPSLASSPYANIFQEGKSLNVKHLYHATGVDPLTGVYTFEDVNNDGAINTNDMQFIKEVSQSYYGGFDNTFSWRNFQVNMLLQFVRQTGTEYVSGIAGYFGSGSLNLPQYLADNWKTSGDNTRYQRLTQQSSAASSAFDNVSNSDLFIVDASFIRLKNLSVSYQIPSKWLQKLHLQETKFFIQGQNLATITNYKGLDPETQGISVPPLRMINFGVHLSL